VSDRTDWRTYSSVSDLLAKSHANDCSERIKKYKSLVPVKWEMRPDDLYLYNWRQDCKPYRDYAGAHIIDQSIEKATINRVRDGIKLVTGLVHDAEIIFLGASSPMMLDCAKRFWNFAEIGFTNRQQQHP
jgi:hypothetical protein